MQERVHSTSIGFEATSEFLHQLVQELEDAVAQLLVPAAASLEHKQEVELGTLITASSLVRQWLDLGTRLPSQCVLTPSRLSVVRCVHLLERAVCDRARRDAAIAATIPFCFFCSFACRFLGDCIPWAQGKHMRIYTTKDSE